MKAVEWLLDLRKVVLRQLRQPPIADVAPLVLGRWAYSGVAIKLLDEPVLRLVGLQS